jgi:type I restriction enzyme S subunit
MVEWKKLGDICSFKRGRTITAKDAVVGSIPVVAGGQTPSYYHNEANRLGESITIAGSGAYAGFVAYWNQPIFVSDAFTVDPNELLHHKYLFHWLKLNQQRIFDTQKGAGVPHVHGKDIANFNIPIPSLSEQTRIVGILDTFTASIENLKEQIAERRKQYEHYRDQLLDLEGKEGVEMKTLGNVGEICMCKRIMKDQTSDKGEIPFFKIGTFGGQADAYITRNLFEEYKNKFSYPKKGEILISAAGTIGRSVIFDGVDAYFQDSNIVWIANDEMLVTNRYLYYFYQIADWKTDGGTIKRLYNYNLKNTEIKVPPLEEQSRIVSILDTFEASIANLEAQLKEREKQYEYYRNKLLTFE